MILGPDDKPFTGSMVRTDGHWSADGLVLFPDFFTGDTGLLHDLSSGDNHGTITGATWQGQGLSFDGVGDFVTLNNHISFADNESWTVGIWAKSTHAGTETQALFGDSVNSNFHISFDHLVNQLIFRSASGEIQTIPELNDISALTFIVLRVDAGSGTSHPSTV